MIRRASLVALAVVTAVNAAVVLGVARDGTDGPGVWLDERELELQPARENSAAILRWRVQQVPMREECCTSNVRPWFDTDVLASLGFDCSVRPGDPGAPEFYDRQLNRRAFVVFDLASDDWAGRLATWQRSATERLERSGATFDASAPDSLVEAIADANERASRMVPVDAGLVLESLRTEYPDRGRHIILPAVVGVVYDSGARSAGPSVTGRIHSVLPSEIQVPSRVRTVFAGLREDTAAGLARRMPYRDVLAGLTALEHRPRFRVSVRVTSLGRPRIEGAQRLP